MKNMNAFLKGFFFLAAAISVAADWPQWRGPNRDGRVTGFTAPASWPKTLKEEWRVTVGEGHSSPLLVNNWLYVIARQGDNEVVMALDSSSGKEMWRDSYPASYTMHPAATDHGKGPKSTPVYNNGRLFTLGINGVLSSYDAKSGKLQWRKEFSGQYPATSPLFGTAMSPIVDGNLCIAYVGGQDRGALTAFDVQTGTVKWSFSEDGPAYSSPVIMTLAGVRQLVLFSQRHLVGVAASTGQMLWKLPAKTQYDTNSVTVLPYKDTVIYSKEEYGTAAIRLESQAGKLEPKEAWRNTQNELYMNSPVAEGNLIYGLSTKNKGQFFCIDADSGRTIWQSPGRMGENAAIVNTGKYLLMLTNDAKLIVLPTGSKEYAPAAEYEVAKSPTWAHPVVNSNRIYIKDQTTLAALSF